MKSSNGKVEFHNMCRISITGEDLQTLEGLNWLNDNIVNFYMSMIEVLFQVHSSTSQPDLIQAVLLNLISSRRDQGPTRIFPRATPSPPFSTRGCRRFLCHPICSLFSNHRHRQRHRLSSSFFSSCSSSRLVTRVLLAGRGMSTSSVTTCCWWLSPSLSPPTFKSPSPSPPIPSVSLLLSPPRSQMPIHLGMHWCLAAVDLRHMTINYYDRWLWRSSIIDDDDYQCSQLNDSEVCNIICYL